MKAPDMKFVLVPQGARTHQAGHWGHGPPEICKTEHSETSFPAFLRQGWSSSLVSKRCLFNKLKKNRIVKMKKENTKTPKYWNQSTGRELRNDQTIRPASGLKQNHWYITCLFLHAQCKMFVNLYVVLAISW